MVAATVLRGRLLRSRGLPRRAGGDAGASGAPMRGAHPRAAGPRPCAARGDEASAAPHPDGEERFRLNNLSPFEGSKRPKRRIGRGYGSGQGGSAGKGMRGQNARSGSGTRPGFEGGQNPLYRRLPKLKGIAGGMGAGVPDFNVVNVGKLCECFSEGEEVSIEALGAKRIMDLSGWKRDLPLKVLGDGDIDTKLVVKAGAFSKTAKEKIEAAGGEAIVLPGRKKWTRKEHEEKLKASPGSQN